MQNSTIKLKRTVASDLVSLYEFQLDKDANYLAAFTSKDYDNKEAYIEKHTQFLHDPTINTYNILSDEILVGSIGKFEREGDAEITYWIDRAYWGQGIATTALQLFLTIENARPIFGRTAFDNAGSRRVLEKCGFVRIGTDTGFANARETVIEQFIYKLI